MLCLLFLRCSRCSLSYRNPGWKLPEIQSRIIYPKFESFSNGHMTPAEDPKKYVFSSHWGLPSSEPSRESSREPSREHSRESSREPVRKPSGKPSREPSREPLRKPSKKAPSHKRPLADDSCVLSHGVLGLQAVSWQAWWPACLRSHLAQKVIIV